MHERVKYFRRILENFSPHVGLNMKNGSFLDQSKACTITYYNFEKKIHKEVV